MHLLCLTSLFTAISLLKSLLLALLTFIMRSTFKRLLITFPLASFQTLRQNPARQNAGYTKPKPNHFIQREHYFTHKKTHTIVSPPAQAYTPPSCFPGEAGTVPCTTCAQTPSSSPGEGFTKAAGSVQPRAGSWETGSLKHEQLLLFLVWLLVQGRTAACKGHIYSAAP